jgi:two-component system, OmpR family, KDP operon response regulator KdpE
MSENKPRVLVVDDEQAIRRFLKITLMSQTYTFFEAASGREALVTAAAQKPDIIILDLGLPDMDGVEVVRQLREWTQTPIIILSVRGSESDKIAALDAGADDYLTKPFGTGELIARMRAALRRAVQTTDEPVFKSGSLEVDLSRRVVSVESKEVQLTRNEYELLRVLVANAGKVMTQRQLLKGVWGPGYEQEFHMLQVNISNLRAKIEPEAGRTRLIVTEPGVGYRLKVT